MSYEEEKPFAEQPLKGISRELEDSLNYRIKQTKKNREEKFQDVRIHRAAWAQGLYALILRTNDEGSTYWQKELDAYERLFDLLEIEFFGGVER